MESGPPEKDASDPVKKPRPRRPTKPTLDLDAAVRALEFKPREMPEEMNARLQEAKTQADHERWKEKFTLIAILGGLLSIGGPCLFLAMSVGSPEDKKWAMSIVASIVSGFVGYLVGGRSNKSG